ncbi:MAG: oligopeptide transporter, OPT family [Gammaproteobacteria bacterium]|nr:oligopeptide transporter, OPT family [Gammaproteobacteria bacterium]
MNKSFIPPEAQIPEITVKVIIISVFLTLILAASNAYLALKVGILTSASIPAAILSMSILRWFKNSTILENNLIQTAASAGEAVAGGIVYTIPALILIHYWTHFPYWENVFIALSGGILGVMVSIPLRQVLLSDPKLKFPEGRAIAQVLIAGTEKGFDLKPMIFGASLGAVMEFAQTGIKVFTTSVQGWFSAGKTLVGFGVGFSATMLGIGYLVGFEIGVSLLIGAVLSWGLLIPILSNIFPSDLSSGATSAAISLWGDKIRYVGIGAMLTAGVWTLLGLLKPFVASLQSAARALQDSLGLEVNNVLRTERDLPLHYVCLGLLLCLSIMYCLFSYTFNVPVSPTHFWAQSILIWGSLLYVLIGGFIFSAICGYFSGMVGVTASPGSAVIIAALFIAAMLLKLFLLTTSMYHILTTSTQLHAAAISIFIGAIITGAACIANDNIQDLKVGQLVGATPWKQQVMLLFGVVIASLIIPPIMELLFNVYGVGDVLPRADMNIANALPAPPAAMMAAVTDGVFHNSMPWNMISLGIIMGVVLIILQAVLKRRNIHFSVIGVATGMYLPLTTSTPIFIGSLLQKVAQGRRPVLNKHHSSLIACGLVTGAALMDVLLAIPFSLMENPDALAIFPAKYSAITNILGIVAFAGLSFWLFKKSRESTT